METQTDTKLGLFTVLGLLIALSQVFCEVFKQVYLKFINIASRSGSKEHHYYPVMADYTLSPKESRNFNPYFKWDIFLEVNKTKASARSITLIDWVNFSLISEYEVNRNSISSLLGL